MYIKQSTCFLKNTLDKLTYTYYNLSLDGSKIPFMQIYTNVAFIFLIKFYLKDFGKSLPLIQFNMKYHATFSMLCLNQSYRHYKRLITFKKGVNPNKMLTLIK